MNHKLLITLTILLIACSFPAFAQDNLPLTPPEGFTAFDTPNDSGKSISLTWEKTPWEKPDTLIRILTSDSVTGTFTSAAEIPSNTHYKSDQHFPFWFWKKTDEHHFISVNTDAKSECYVKMQVIHKDTILTETPVLMVKPEGNVFNWLKLNNLLFMIIFSAIIIWFIRHAKRKDLFLRKIPGLAAVDEAIGRATEMGKPIYYLTGRLTMSSISTIAATVILGEIAKKTAAYETQIKVPHTDPIVMAVCKEITKEAYVTAGHPDNYSEDSNFYITDDQFSYAAAVDGLMLREKPAACFFMGYYYAEALLLAETGASAGAIQIAGTDAEHQLPFFVTACDYTLIGEELYAASAYLSREPVLVGTLRGQDVGKAIIMIFIILCLIAAVISITGIVSTDSSILTKFAEILKDF